MYGSSEPPDQVPFRTSATMRNAEEPGSGDKRRAQITRFGQADHGVHVGTIEVHLTAGRMHHVANFSDGRFKNTVWRDT